VSAAAGTPALQRVTDALGAWLPGRVAHHVLRRAMEAEGLRPNDMNEERLVALLLGPVYRDLRDAVPRDVLRRELELLVRSLRQRDGLPPEGAAATAAPAEATAPPVEATTPPAEATTPPVEATAAVEVDAPRRRAPLRRTPPAETPAGETPTARTPAGETATGRTPSNVTRPVEVPPQEAPPADPRLAADEIATPVPEVTPIAPPLDAGAAPPNAAADRAPSAGQPGGTGAEHVTPPPQPSLLPTTRRAPLDDPEAVLMALGTLDGVDGAAIFDAVGHCTSTRGQVPEVASLGRVIAAGGGLLQRHGTLRSVSVATTTGVIVVVSAPPRWIAVSGAPDMNLGAVYAALTALEEER
jgi:hypothetical protein